MYLLFIYQSSPWQLTFHKRVAVSFYYGINNEYVYLQEQQPEVFQ